MTLKNYLRTAFRWQLGRQASGYDKILLLTARLPFKVQGFDSYLIRYPIGSFIPPHTDPVSNKHHYRLNLIIKPSKSGGEFICPHAIIDGRFVKLFRPDLHEHSVTPVIDSSRYVLSIGWILPKTEKN